MDIWLDSTENKRIDLCVDYKVTTGETKERRFVVKYGMQARAFETLLDAVHFYESL